MGHVAIHDAVLSILDRMERCRLLDVPCGEGALAERLAANGFTVVCADLFPGIFKAEGLTVTKADLGETIPFETGSFGAVVCLEGLEHIENPSNAISEFARVLAADGRLIISVPNILNIEERLKWLLFGYTSHFKPVSHAVLEAVREEYGNMDAIALHINPIGYSEVRYLLEKNGLELIGVHIDKRKRDWPYLPLVWLIRLISRLTPARKRRDRWAAELSSDPVLRGGNTVIFEAVKQ